MLRCTRTVVGRSQAPAHRRALFLHHQHVRHASLDAGPLPVFIARVASGELRGGDSRQVEALQPLQRLFEGIVQAQSEPAPLAADAASAAVDNSGGGWCFSAAPAETPRPTARGASTAKGVYTHGGVGCGKTMLMDLFAECVLETIGPATLQVKQVHRIDSPRCWTHNTFTSCLLAQVHFAAFMLDVHKRLHQLKQQVSASPFVLCLASHPALAIDAGCGRRSRLAGC